MAFDSSNTTVTYQNVPHQINEESINSWKLGSGINIVDATPRATPFYLIIADFQNGSRQLIENKYYLNSFEKFEKTCCNLVGLNNVKGAFSYSLGSSIKTPILEDELHSEDEIVKPIEISPFLVSIEKSDHMNYLIYSLKSEVYSLELTDAKPRIMGSKKVKAIEKLNFNQVTKSQFYAIIEKFGTHYINKVNMGFKAELLYQKNYSSEQKIKSIHASLNNSNSASNSNSNSASTSASNSNSNSASTSNSTSASNSTINNNVDANSVDHRIISEFEIEIANWSQKRFAKSRDFKANEEQLQFRTTPNFDKLLVNKNNINLERFKADFAPISFTVAPLSQLFYTATRNEHLKTQIDLAIESYIEEKRFRRSNDFNDGAFVRLRCLENGNFIRVDNLGKLVADVAPDQSMVLNISSQRLNIQQLQKEDKLGVYFEIRKKGDKCALRSVAFNKYVSRSTTKSHFRFAFLPVFILGPSQTFSISGDYFLAYNIIDNPRYIRLAQNDLMADGTSDQRARLCLCLPDTREFHTDTKSEDLIEQEATENPSFPFKTSFADTETAIVTTTESKSAPATTTITTPTTKPTVAKSKPLYPVGIAGKVKKQNKAQTKFNSTSSIYISDSINAPNVKTISLCIARAILIHIRQGHKLENPKLLDIFDENKNPIFGNKILNTQNVPQESEVFRFLGDIYRAMKMSAECGIMALAYIERVISHTEITLHASNWRRICLSSFLLASKVWEEMAVWNVDFIDIFPGVSIRDLNRMEKQFLMFLQYNVSLKASLYTKYYFELKNLSEVDEFPLKPMNMASLQAIEDRSFVVEGRVRTREKEKKDRRRLSSSFDSLPQTRAVLS
eukprot:TRINITY_DN2189_c0_g1_i2.p1 TRINITY_DN2189_c0_g1~~TRINITY_DN2189_c0_g1_i2.p1  ORF type:complete len:857 (+),score=356.85 TRINITY_DN2189_c0_g1_i2:34-2571(+)